MHYSNGNLLVKCDLGMFSTDSHIQYTHLSRVLILYQCANYLASVTSHNGVLLHKHSQYKTLSCYFLSDRKTCTT